MDSIRAIFATWLVFPVNLTAEQIETRDTCARLLPYACYATCVATALLGAGAIYSTALLWKAATMGTVLKATISLIVCEELCREVFKVACIISKLVKIIRNTQPSNQVTAENAREIRAIAASANTSLWLSKNSSIHGVLEQITTTIPAGL